MSKSKPQVFMMWQETTPDDTKLDMSHSVTMAVQHFEAKYNMGVKTITCHPDSLSAVRAAVPSVEVYADKYVFNKRHLHLYGDNDAKHKEEKLND